MTNGAQTARAAIPAKTCDIVLKGGITSGVVYPLALTELARQYRFSSIGGTSAGAMAAAAAAAAEYGRQTGHPGFERLAQIPEEIGPNLLAMFQPTPVLKPVFDIFVAAMGAKSKIAVVWAAIKGYWSSALLGVILGLAIVVLAALYGDVGLILFGLLLAFVESGESGFGKGRFRHLPRHPPAACLIRSVYRLARARDR
jgi:hypothetical protein